MSLVLFELAPIVPVDGIDGHLDRFKEIEPVVEGAAYSVHAHGDNLAVAATTLSPAVLRERAAKYPRRVAIGAKEAWDRFPEYRGEFIGTIERDALQGTARGSLRLDDTVIDDSLADMRLKLLEQKSFSGFPVIEGTNIDEFVVEASQLQPYEHLAKHEPCEPMSIEGKHLFFCDYFSVRGGMGKALVPGIKFLSPHALHAYTDFDEVWRALTSSARPAGFSPRLVELFPNQFTGVLVLDNPNNVYDEIVVRRVLAAAALAGTAYGKVLASAILTKNSSHISRVTEFGTRPYCDRSLPDKNIIDLSNERFLELLVLISRGSHERLEKGKEDYRLLALDVVEDARRSSVPTLAYAQIWMAIEKLLAVRNEISAQISLALTAFSPSAERAIAFEKLKGGYALRSNIVHGYSFKSSDFQVFPTEEVAKLFRLLFIASLKYDNSRQLFTALWDHVLSGVNVPFSAAPSGN